MGVFLRIGSPAWLFLELESRAILWVPLKTDKSLSCKPSTRVRPVAPGRCTHATCEDDAEARMSAGRFFPRAEACFGTVSPAKVSPGPLLRCPLRKRKPPSERISRRSIFSFQCLLDYKAEGKSDQLQSHVIIRDMQSMQGWGISLAHA